MGRGKLRGADEPNQLIAQFRVRSRTENQNATEHLFHEVRQVRPARHKQLAQGRGVGDDRHGRHCEGPGTDRVRASARDYRSAKYSF